MEKESIAPKNETAEKIDSGFVRGELSSLSIKSFLKAKPKENIEEIADLPFDDFSNEQLTQLWTKFLSNIKTDSNNARISILENIVLEKIDKKSIKITSPSFSSQNEFEEVRQNFMVFLKKELNNFSLEIVYELKEDKSEPTILSKEDIYKILLKKNKNLELLRTKLGLDFNG